MLLSSGIKTVNIFIALPSEFELLQVADSKA